MDDVTCQFCGEEGFDLPGLKTHLLRGWCDAFEAITACADPVTRLLAARERVAEQARAAGPAMLEVGSTSHGVQTARPPLCDDCDHRTLCADFPSQWRTCDSAGNAGVRTDGATS